MLALTARPLPSRVQPAPEWCDYALSNLVMLQL